MEIEVVEVKKCVKEGNLKAFVDVKLDNILIKDFRIIQQKDQRAWVSVPQASWKDSTGQLAYKNLIEIPKDLKASIEKAVLEYYEKQGR